MAAFLYAQTSSPIILSLSPLELVAESSPEASLRQELGSHGQEEELHPLRRRQERTATAGQDVQVPLLFHSEQREL
jgi:hypothetical protein